MFKRKAEPLISPFKVLGSMGTTWQDPGFSVREEVELVGKPLLVCLTEAMLQQHIFGSGRIIQLLVLHLAGGRCEQSRLL